MTSRPGVEVTSRWPADGGESPNRYQPFVSAHLRVYWPPLATDVQIASALREVVNQAEIEILKRRERTPRGHEG